MAQMGDVKQCAQFDQAFGSGFALLGFFGVEQVVDLLFGFHGSNVGFFSFDQGNELFVLNWGSVGFLNEFKQQSLVIGGASEGF